LNLAILGAGAWGTALAIAFSAQHRVRLWEGQADAYVHLARSRVSRFLPEAPLPDGVTVTDDLAQALADADMALVVTPTAFLEQAVRDVAAAGAPPGLLWACKGFVRASGRLAHEVVAAQLPGARRVGVLSGPSFALEVARGLPTALVCASGDAAFAAEAAGALNAPRLRIYSSRDVVGVELGGALKNVIALAAGISDGLALGFNARAALITRGLAEMARLGVAMGGQAETFNGLAGMGDLVLTCTGELSRNRTLGKQIAMGVDPKAYLASQRSVAEGYYTAAAATALARKVGVDMPITENVYAVLHEARPLAEAVQILLERDYKDELAGIEG
jgi:glycerol-3-phosphate dehydrogenase (NAD(P)+)